MKYEHIEFENIGESMYVYNHPSGLKAFVIPKKGYLKKHATFATHYGSINNDFVAPGDSEPTKVPEGIAHFLEHKLFEQKDGSVMDKFTELGATPNAYTGFDQTVYHFSCTDKFEDNFKLLLEFVQNPYITQESVEKEKGIIGQEISMYEDDPGWRSYFNLLGSLYKSNPVRVEIAGTKESIAKIDKDSLYKCYNTFYHPSNMVICAIGDIDPEQVLQLVEQGIQSREEKGPIKRLFPDEDKAVNKNYAEQSLAVSMPMFQLGFKDNREDLDSTESLKHEAAMKVIIDLIMGRSSKLYNDLYSEGLINSNFEFDYTLEDNYAFSVFGGESPSPEKVRDRILQELREIKKKGLDREGFERIKKAHYGRFIRQFNSVERTAGAFIGVYFRGINLFDYLDVYDKISYEYGDELFKEHYNEDYQALSVIKPF